MESFLHEKMGPKSWEFLDGRAIRLFQPYFGGLVAGHVFTYETAKIGGTMKRILLRDERGAAALEFAIISVVLLMIVFGVIEFGILMFDKQVLTNASREGTRAGIVMRVPRLSDTDIEGIVEAHAQEYMVSFGTSSTLTTTVTPVEASRVGNLFGTELKVTVTYPFDFLVLSGFGLGPITLTAETRMLME